MRNVQLQLAVEIFRFLDCDMKNRYSNKARLKQSNPLGGARSDVESHSYQLATQPGLIPWIVARIYSPPSIVNTDLEREAQISTFDSIYIPIDTKSSIKPDNPLSKRWIP